MSLKTQLEDLSFLFYLPDIKMALINPWTGLNIFNVSVDLTRWCYLLIKTAKGLIEDNPNVSFVSADINCSQGLKFKNGSCRYFNSLNELHSLFWLQSVGNCLVVKASVI